jgi:superfamily I DNA/RNA helicase
MKILLVGPGTGKTTNIKSIIEGQSDPSKILVLSFTNATVEDLKASRAIVVMERKSLAVS